MQKSISLQSKLIMLVSLVTIAMTAIIVAFHAHSLRQSVEETFSSQMTGITTAINARYEESRSVDDIQQMFDYIQLRNPDVLILTLHGEDGRMKASTLRRNVGSASPDYVRQSLMESKTFVDQQPISWNVPAVRLLAPLIEDGATVGAIELVLNSTQEESLIRSKVETAIWVAFFSGTGFMVALWFILRKLLVMPLLKLRQAAIAIKQGERIHRVEMNASLEITEVADAFNDMVENMDARYNELQEALHTLKTAQEHLVQTEKMVALGRLVAGIAHEINTPVGVGVTAVSYLEQRTNEFAALYAENRMKKSDLESYLKSTEETVDMIQVNLRRASELIKSFKQVSVDQSSEEKRRFRLLEYIDDIVRSLQPTIRKTGQRMSVFGDRELEVFTYPGAISQIVTNLVMNSLIHAFDSHDEGYMMIRVHCKDERMIVQYADDGKGMPKEVADKIFDPFFTTNRSRGGTGLGMHIVYNLVTQKLGGMIECHSEVGRGTTFIFDFPIPQEGSYGLQSA